MPLGGSLAAFPSPLGLLVLSSQPVHETGYTSQTIKELAANSKHLGAEIGIVVLLHTCGQKMEYHVHAHCICTGGGIAPDGMRWVPCKRSNDSQKDFFIHQQVLALKFRGKFIAFLKKAYYKGELSFHGELRRLNNADEFERLLDKSVKKRWVAYVKEPLGDKPEEVLKYLARYTHRVAISNSRLIAMRDGRVYFRYKDYRGGGEWKTTSLEGTEFIRRFLLHVLPSGFMKIRHYGFLANRFRKEKLALCRKLLGVCSSQELGDPPHDPGVEPKPEAMETDRRLRCPKCKTGRMGIVQAIPADAVRRQFEREITLPARASPTSVCCETP